MKSITLNKDTIIIHFDYTPGLVAAVKTEVPNRRYADREWYTEATPENATAVLAFAKRYGFKVDPTIQSLLTVTKPMPSYKKKHRDVLYGFQKLGVDFLHASGGRAILADDMGSGKTIQTLVWAFENGFKRMLIIAPATVVFKWKNEVAMWIPEKSSEVTVTSREPLPTTDIVIMSYAIFINRIQELKDKFDIMVIDEVHRGFSNSRTKSWKAAKLMQVEKTILLSGTPFLNRPKELWSLLNLIRPRKWTSFFWFGNKYCAGFKDRWGWNFDGKSNIDELKSEISPYFLRRTKQEVLPELPPLQRIYLPILLNSKDMTEYKHLKSIGANDFELLHQAGRGKVDAALEIATSILEDPAKKVIIYCHHLDVLQSIDIAMREKYNIRIIQGDITQHERMKCVQDFQTNPDVRVMLITSAGGEGIDLYVASDIIFVERAWNPGKEEQVEGRVHRIGQKDNVTAHYIIAKNTVDENPHEIVGKKRKVLKEIIGMDTNEETTITGELMNWLEEVRRK